MAGYARHRGVHQAAVLRAIRKGRLKRSVARDAKGRHAITDVALADAEWAANTDLTKAPTKVKERAAARDEGRRAPSGLADAAAEEKRWRAKRAQLEYQRISGDLVSASAVRAGLAEVLARFRTKTLGLPSKAKQMIPDLAPADVLALQRIAREMLEELATMGQTNGTTTAA